MKLQQKHILRISIASGLIAFWVFVAMIMFGCAGVQSSFSTVEFTLPSVQVKIVDSSNKMPYNCAGNNALGCMTHWKGLTTIYLLAHKQHGKYYPNEWVLGHEIYHVLNMRYPQYFDDPDRIGKFGFSDE
jgi:hypothetical protein